MPMIVPEFDYGLCVKCGKCAAWCPLKVITMTRPDYADESAPCYPEKSGAACLGCAQCMGECTHGAIRMVRFGG